MDNDQMRAMYNSFGTLNRPQSYGDDLYNDRENIIPAQPMTQTGEDEVGNPIMAPVEMPEASNKPILNNVIDVVSDAVTTPGAFSGQVGPIGAMTDTVANYIMGNDEQRQQILDRMQRYTPQGIESGIKSVIHSMSNATELEHTKLYENYFYNAEKKNAEIKRIANLLQIDENAFAHDRELYQKAALAADRVERMGKFKKYQDAEGNIDMAKIYADVPGLAEVQQKQGTAAAALALGNIDGIKSINEVYDNAFSRFAGSVYAGARRGYIADRRSAIWNAARKENRLPTVEEQAKLDEYDAELRTLPKYNYNTVGNVAGAMIGGAAENLAMIVKSQGAGMATRIAVGRLGGAKAGDIAGNVVSTYMMAQDIAGNQYEQLVNKTDANGRPMYTPEQASWLALSQGYAEAALEQWSLNQMGKAIFGRSAAKSLTEIIKTSPTIEAAKAGIRDYAALKISEAGKAGFISLGSEAFEEFTQGASDMLLENLAQVLLKGKDADVASVEDILASSTGQMVEALPAIGGFGLIGFGANPIANTRAVLGFRSNVRNVVNNKVLIGRMANAHYGEVLDGVWKNKGNIKELQDKAPESVTTILDTQNRLAGMEDGFIDVRELSKENADLVDQIAEANNISKDELAACLDGSGMLQVKTSTLMQMDLKDEQHKAIRDNVTTSLDAFTLAQENNAIKLVKEQMDSLQAFNDKTYKQAVENIISARFPDAEQAKLAREIIEANYDNPQEEFKRRLDAVNAEMDEYIAPVLAELRSGMKQGVDIIRMEGDRDAKYVKQSNNADWYRNYYADYGRAPNAEELRNLAIDIASGRQNNRYGLMDYQNNTDESREYFGNVAQTLDKLEEQRNALMAIQDRMRDLNPGEMVATASLSKEGLKVYDTMRQMMGESENKDVRKAGAFNALFLARYADNMAKAISKARNIPYTAEDFVRDRFRIDVNAEYNEELMAAQMFQVSPAEFERQKAEVRSRYENTDQWLKAPNGEDTNLTEDQWVTVRTDAFKNWFGDWENDTQNASKVLDENGEPLMVFHGTVSGEFDTFDRSYSSIEGDMGAGFYFTNNRSDVEANYEDGGPDFDNKVARRAEQIESEGEIDYSEAEEQAREELYKESALYKTFLNIRYPAYVQTTTLFEDIELEDEINEEDYESEEEYYEARDNAVQDAWSDKIYDITGRVEAEDLMSDASALSDALWEVIYDGGMTIPQLKEKINDIYPETSEGEWSANEIVRIIIDELGYDGIIDTTVSQKFRGMRLDPDTTHYIAFEPNQIKDASGRNVGFDPNSGNIYLQEAMPERDLVAYHNMREDSLLKSAALGGLPVPSIAVTRKDIPFNQFGGITLIGGSDIIDPARRGNDVFSRDAWTTTFPEVVYDKVKVGDIRNFRENVREAFKAFGNEGNTQLSEFSYKLESGRNRRSMQDDLYYSLPMRYKFITEELGDSVKISFKKRPVQDEFILKSKKIRDLLKEAGYEPSKENLKKISDIARKSVEKYAEEHIPQKKAITINGEEYTDKGPSLNGRVVINSKGESQSPGVSLAVTTLLERGNVENTIKHLESLTKSPLKSIAEKAKNAIEFINNSKIENDDLKQQLLDIYFDKNGLLKSRQYESLFMQSRRYGEVELDRGKVKGAIDKKIDKHEKQFTDYINRQLDKLYRNPQIMVGNKKKDVTLENIVDAMIKKRGAGKEDSFTFNNHKAIASMAKKFNSLAEIRRNKDQLTDSEKADLSFKVFEDVSDQYRKDVAQYHKYKDESYLDVYDDANKAIVDAAKGGGTESAIRNALRRNYFNDVPDSIVEQVKNALAAAKEIKTDYFEAKPLRSVGFNEFAAAVVPKGTSKEAVDFLKNQGVVVTKYDPDVPGDRQAKTQKAAEKAKVYFQQGRTAKGAISLTEQGQKIISLFESADQSTFVHEMAHMFLLDLQEIAGVDRESQQAKDLDTIMKWAEYKPGQADEYKGTASAAEFRKREQAIKEAEAKGDEAEARRLKDVWAQERFARAFEEYLKSGEAPAQGLKRAFRAFKKWLVQIYNDVLGAGVRATPEVEAVMARMVASEEEIDAMEAANAIARIRKVDADILSTDAQEMIQRWQTEAKEQAKEKMLKELMKEYEQNNLKDIDKRLEQFKETAREELQNVPCFVCEQLLKDGTDMASALEITGFANEQEYKDALKSAGGSLENALNKMTEQAKANMLTEMPSKDKLYSMAEEALLSGDYNTRLAELEAQLLKRRQARYDNIPTRLRNAFSEMDEAIKEFEAAKVKEAVKKLKYAERWDAKNFETIKELESYLAKMERQGEDRAKLIEKFNKRYNELKEVTVRNTKWLQGVRDATLGHARVLQAAAVFRLAEESVSVATNARYWHRQALKEAKRAWDNISGAQRTGREANFNAAVDAKQQQAVLDAMTAQAIKNKKQVDKWLNGARDGFKARAKRMADPKVKANVDMRYFHNHLLYVFGLRNSDAIPPTNYKSFQDLLAELRASHQFEDEVPAWLVSAAEASDQGKNYQQLTMGELEELYKLTRILYRLGLNDKGLLTMDVDMDTVVAECTADWMQNTDYEVGNQRINEVKGAIGSYMNGLLKPEVLLSLLGGEQGGFVKYIYRVLFNAAEAEEKAREKEAKVQRELYSKYYTKEELRAMVNDPVYINVVEQTEAGSRTVTTKQKLTIGEDTDITKENLICMALNWGNEANKARLLVGLFDCKNETQLAQREMELKEILQAQLTKKDWEFVQAMWDHIGEFADPVSEVMEKSVGVPLDRVKAQAFDVEVDGEVLRLAGGYYPIVKDSSKSVRQTEFEQMEEAKAIGGVSVFGTGMSATKERAKNMFLNQGPLKLTLDVANNHITAQIHLINAKMAVRDAYKVINNKQIQDMVRRTCGEETVKTMNDWVLNCWAPPIRPRSWYENIAASLRSKTVGAIMGYRVSTALLNAANVVYMAQEIGTKNTLAAIVDFYRHPIQNREMILDISVYMRNRATNMDRDLQAQNEQILKRHTKVGNAIDKATGGKSEDLRYQMDKYANWLIEQTDMMVSMPMYMWQFKQTYSEEIAKGVPEEEARETANYEAVRRMTKVFPSSRAVDSSAIQRTKSEMTKLITPFFSFANTMMNAVWSKYYAGKFKGSERVEMLDDNGQPMLDEDGEPKYTTVKKSFVRRYGRFARAILFNFVLGAMVETLLRQVPDALAGTGDDDDDKFYSDLRKNVLSSAAAGFPGVNEGVNFLYSTFFEKPSYMGGRGVGVLSGTVQRYSKVVTDIAKITQGKDSIDAIDLFRDVARATNTKTGISDTLTDAIFNTARFIGDDYRFDDMADLREYIAKTIFDRKLKKK